MRINDDDDDCVFLLHTYANFMQNNYKTVTKT